MEIWRKVQDRLDEFIEGEVSLPLNSKQLGELKKWRPVLEIKEEVPIWNSEAKGLCRLRAMVIDQEDPDFCLSYFFDRGKICSTLFGNFNEDAQYIDGVFTQRYPILCSGVPGEEKIEGVPRVLFYDSSGEKVTVSSIIDVIGVALNSEFHVICFTPERPVAVEDRRESILRGLEVCLGDRFLSEVFLYVLLSSIKERSSLLGLFPINLTKLTSAEVLANSLKSLTRTVYLELSLNNLNTQSFTPSKDPETDKLTQSPLQIPPNTLLLIDETKLNQGPLTSQGLQNLNTLLQLIHSQTLTYNFGFSQLSFPTDLRILVCSTGSSMLKIPNTLPVSQMNPYDFSTSDRLYLESCSSISVTLPENLVKTAQDYFVAQRKSSNLPIDDFHTILLLTRYTAQSFRCETATTDHWTNALSLYSFLKSYRL